MTTDTETVDISDLSKAAVLTTLFNHSQVFGMGILQAHNGPQVMTVEYAQNLLDNGGQNATTDYPGNFHRGLYFDYVYGRILKVNIEGDTFDPALYDRDLGKGAAQRAINEMRESLKAQPSGA